MGCGASSSRPEEYEPMQKPKSGQNKAKRSANYDGRDEAERKSAAESISMRWDDSMDDAAGKIGAFAKGKADRLALEAKSNAAKLVQSRVRGKEARRKTDRMRAEKVLETESATLRRSKSSSTVLAVNDYKMGKQLGKGAYGQVWKATRGDETAAVKVLSRSILRRKRVGRFGSAYDSVMGEIAVMKQLNHPNIVQLYEVIDDPDEDLLFMVMELVPGGDLSEPVKAKRHVPDAELRLWLNGLTLGLEHLHLCGVCHRDIKPENILWDKKRGVAKLSDFGISVFYKVSAKSSVRGARPRRAAPNCCTVPQLLR